MGFKAGMAGLCVLGCGDQGLLVSNSAPNVTIYLVTAATLAAWADAGK